MFRLDRFVLAVAVTAVPMAANSATLTMVPMQGGMVMPMIAYHASDNTLTVKLMPAAVQLTPLLVSNPNDGFDPAAPWFADLDPAGLGLSFSRRYGFVMDSMSDPLPGGLAIWIRNLSMSPGLAAWKYRANPQEWEPIFGTAGSPDVYRWDSAMFHPTFGAVPGTNTFSAQFEAFLVNSGSEQPLANGSTGPFTLTFTNMPDGRPHLWFADGRVRWPAAATNYVIECCDSISAPNWGAVTNSIQQEGTDNCLTLDPNVKSRFFRLKWARQ